MSSISSSSSPKKQSQKCQSEMISTVAYIHNLSPVKRNRSHSIDYESMTLRTESNKTVEHFYTPPPFPPRTVRPMPRELRLKDHTHLADKNKIVINEITNSPAVLWAKKHQIVQINDKSMKLCHNTYDLKTNIFWYRDNLN